MFYRAKYITLFPGLKDVFSEWFWLFVLSLSLVYGCLLELNGFDYDSKSNTASKVDLSFWPLGFGSNRRKNVRPDTIQLKLIWKNGRYYLCLLGFIWSIPLISDTSNYSLLAGYLLATASSGSCFHRLVSIKNCCTNINFLVPV